MSDIKALQAQIDALKKAKQDRWEPLRKKYGNEKKPAKVLYKCLINEDEGKDEDQWIENIKICFNQMDSPDPTKILLKGVTYKSTILGIMITWQKDHPKVEKFLREKLDFHKVIDGDLYMNTWAWEEEVEGYKFSVWTRAKPVFLAVLYGKTRWLNELLKLGAKTASGYYLRKKFWKSCKDKSIRLDDDVRWRAIGASEFFRRLTPRELNDHFMDPKSSYSDEDVKLIARLKNEGLDNNKLKERVRKIRKEIEQILIVGGANSAKIKYSGNPQGLKLWLKF